MLAVRTVRVEMRLTPEQAGLLSVLRPRLVLAWNEAARYAWDRPSVKNAVSLQNALYDKIRGDHGLPAQFTCMVLRLAFGAVQSARSRAADGQKASCPVIERLPIPYDARTLSLRTDRKSATLATLGKGARIEVAIRRHRRLRRYEGWKCDSGRVTETSDGRWWLDLVMTEERLFSPGWPGRKDATMVCGADRGIAVPMALSHPRKLVGDPGWGRTDRRYIHAKRTLQAKGTTSSRRRLSRMGDRWSRFRRWADKTVARRILESLLPGTVLVLEDLKGIRSRENRRWTRKQRQRLHSWTFRRLQDRLEELAPEYGVIVVYVPAAYTSQRCSVCGYVSRRNRCGRWFRCRNPDKSCGHKDHADLNASDNIAATWLATQQNGQPTVAVRRDHVSPPNAAHDKTSQGPGEKAGTARACAAAKRTRRRVLESPVL